MSERQDITLAVKAPALSVTKEERDARADMVRRFGDPSFLSEVPYEVATPAPLPKLSDEIGERRKLREECAEAEKRIAELRTQLES